MMKKLTIIGETSTNIKLSQLKDRLIERGFSFVAAENADCYLVADGSAINEQLIRELEIGKDMLVLGCNALSFAGNGLGLPIFSENPIYKISYANTLVKSEHCSLDGGEGKFDFTLEGKSAVGVKYLGESEFYPLLELEDRYGRRNLKAVSALCHYSGKFKGSQWIFCGIETIDFYEDSRTVNFFIECLEALFRKEFLQKAVQREEVIFHRKDPAIHIKNTGSYVTIKGSEFYDRYGERIYFAGSNYIGHLYGLFQLSASTPLEIIEQDFAKAHRNGLNCFRLWGLDTHDEYAAKRIFYLAEKYEIYLLIVMQNPIHFSTYEEYLSVVEAYAKICSDSKMVIGYDLCNEPWVQTIAHLTLSGQKGPALSFDVLDRYSQYFDLDYIKTEVEKNYHPGFHFQPMLTNREKLSLRALTNIFNNHIMGSYMGSYAEGYSTFPFYNGKVEYVKDLEPIVEVINQEFGLWIEKCTESIRKHDINHYITVGYDHPYVLLDCNEKLDFISNHIYTRPKTFQHVKTNITTLDRIKYRWPEKAIMLGEFGYSSGIEYDSGAELDVYTACLGELMHYVYTYYKSFSGALIWILNENPIANMARSAPWIGKAVQKYEERFGLFSADGTMEGRGKPIAAGMRAFSKLMLLSEPNTGSFEMFDNDSLIGAGFLFKTERCIFIGCKKYFSSELEIQSENSNVLFACIVEKGIRLLTTADCEVTMDLAAMYGREFEDISFVNGFVSNNRLKGRLLEGEELTLGFKGE